MTRVVGIGEMYISDQAGDIIVTYSLGSCLGVSIYDPEVKVGGMIHTMLPLSQLDRNKAMGRPCMFTDTGLELLLNKLFQMGAKRHSLIIKVAGAASLMDGKHFFRIGERNYAVAQKVFEVNNLKIAASDVLGTASRTMALNMSTGKTYIKSGGKKVEL